MQQQQHQRTDSNYAIMSEASSAAVMSDFEGSPTTDQLIEEGIGEACSPRSLPGEDEDRAFDAIVGAPLAVHSAQNQPSVLGTVGDAAAAAAGYVNRVAPSDNDDDDDVLGLGVSSASTAAKRDDSNSMKNFSSFSPQPTAASAAAAAASRDDDIGVSEEERLLQSMVAALDENGGVLGEIANDTDAVEAALESAIRNAVSGKSSRQKGHTVVQIKEMHGVVTELRNAKAQIGQVTCICAQQDNSNEPSLLPVSRLQLLVGTSSSLVLLFDLRQKLLGVAGTVSDAKGAVTALSCAADGSTFVCSYARLSIILWNSETLEPIRAIDGECSATPFRLSFFRPDNSKFVCVSRDEFKFFHTGKVMGKTIFRSTRLEGLVGAGGMQGPGTYRGGHMADAATATLPDPIAPPGSDLMRFYYAVTTQTELLVGSVQFGLASTTTVVDYRRTIRGPAAGAQAALSHLTEHSAALSSLAASAASKTTAASGSSRASFSASRSVNPSSSSAGHQQQSSALTAGALVAWRKKTKMALSLFLADATYFEVYALIQTQNDASISVVQLNRMEMPLPMRTLNCLDAGCALLGDVHDTLHVVDPIMGTVIESVQSSAGFDMIRRGAFPANVAGSYSDSGAATFFCSADRVAMCTVLSWEARIEALIFLKRWTDALQLTQQFACSENVTAVGLVDANGNRNSEHVKQYAETTLLPALLADGLRNPATFRKLLDRTMAFCQATGLLRQCIPQMLMFCKTINVVHDFCYALENLLTKKDCSGIPDAILLTLAEFFAGEHEKDELKKQQQQQQQQQAREEDEKSGSKRKETGGSNNKNSKLKRSPSPERIDDGNEQQQQAAGEDEDAALEEELNSMTKLQRLERCLMHIVGMDEVILKIAKQYKLWNAVMVVWSLRRGRPDVVIIELSGVADQALVDYFSCIIEGVAPDGITPIENAVDARRKVVAVLQAQASALRRVVQIPGFLDVVRRAMRIQNLWRVDTSSPRYSTASSAPTAAPCDKTIFLSKLDAAIDSVAQPALTSAFLLMWAEEVSSGDSNVADPESFFARVLQHCLPSSATTDKRQLAAARESLQVTLCELLLHGPAFARAKLPDLERALLKGGGVSQLPRVLSTILLRQHRFKDAIDVFFDPRYATNTVNPAASLSASSLANLHALASSSSSSPSSSASSGGAGDIFSFFETALNMFERDRDDRAKEQFTHVVKDSIPRLIAVNSSKLARFVSSHLNDLQPFVLKALPSDSREQCEFLKEFLDRLSSASSSTSSSSSSPSAHNLRALQTRLLQLMCRYDPENLYSYLVERDATIEFDIEPVLKAAQQHNITEACAFLFEKTCQIFEAMKLLIRALDRSVGEFWAEEQKRIAIMFNKQPESCSADGSQELSSSPAPIFKLASFDAEYEGLAALVTSTFTAVRDLDGSDKNNNCSSSGMFDGRQNAMMSNTSIASNSTTSSSFTSASAGGATPTNPAVGTRARGQTLSSQPQQQQSAQRKEPVSPTLATIERLLTAGIGLCRRHATKIDPNELRNAWFTLLDLFAKPKRQFQKRLDAWRAGPTTTAALQHGSGSGNKHGSSKSLKRAPSSLALQSSGGGSSTSFSGAGAGAGGGMFEATLAPSPTPHDFPEMKEHKDSVSSLYGPISSSSSASSLSSSSGTPAFQLSAGGVRFHMTMLKFFVEHSTVILAHMVQALDLKEVIEKIVNDSDEESYASLKPVIVGILDLLRFELVSNDLCRKCACHDVVHLSNELHLMLAGAMPLHGTYCWLCQTHLRRHANDSENMRVFRCGHGFHESCIAGQAECPQCIASSSTSASMDAEMMRRMQQQQQQAPVMGSGSGGRGGGRGKDSKSNDADDGDDTLDPQRCLRRLRHVRAKMDAAKNRRLPLLLSPLPRAPSIAEQEGAALNTRPGRVIDISQTKILPASAYGARALPAHLVAASASAVVHGGGAAAAAAADDSLGW